MKNRKKRIIVNGTLMAAMAAVGVTVFQLGTAPVQEENTQMKSEDSDKDRQEQERIAAVETEQEETGLYPAEETEKETAEETAVGPDDIESEEEGTAAAETEEETEIKAESDTEAEVQDVSAGAVSLPALDFSEDTLMQWPVSGTILLDYSMDQTTYFPTLDQYRLSPAIAVQAVEGAPVMAVANGEIFSIENDAKTGTTVTMELGNGYQAVYGQLQDLNVAEGDIIKEGTIIGYISEPTKYYSTEGSNLYFAMKKDGEPIDPITYLP